MELESCYVNRSSANGILKQGVRDRGKIERNIAPRLSKIEINQPAITQQQL